MTRRCAGQAGVELLAALPVLGLVVLLGWQLIMVLAAGLRAQEEVRRAGLRASGAETVITREAAVPALLPGLAGIRVRARAGVRAP